MSIDLRTIARQTADFSGADLAGFLNEAAILAARANRRTIGMTEFDGAIARFMAGPEQRSRRISEEEKEIRGDKRHRAGS